MCIYIFKNLGCQGQRHIKNRWMGGCSVHALKKENEKQTPNGGFEKTDFKTAAF